MLVKKVAELPDQPAALRGSHLTPRTIIKSFAGGFDGEINVGTITFSNLREDLSGRRIVSRESFARNGVNPFSINEHFAWLLDEAEDARVDLGGGNCSHENLLRFNAEKNVGEHARNNGFMLVLGKIESKP